MLLDRDCIRRFVLWRRERTRLKCRQSAPVLAAVRFKAYRIRVRSVIYFRAAVAVNPVVEDRRARRNLRVGSLNSVPRGQFLNCFPMHDSDTHPYASVSRL